MSYMSFWRNWLGRDRFWKDILMFKSPWSDVCVFYWRLTFISTTANKIVSYWSQTLNGNQKCFPKFQEWVPGELRNITTLNSEPLLIRLLIWTKYFFRNPCVWWKCVYLCICKGRDIGRGRTIPGDVFLFLFGLRPGDVSFPTSCLFIGKWGCRYELSLTFHGLWKPELRTSRLCGDTLTQESSPYPRPFFNTTNYVSSMACGLW